MSKLILIGLILAGCTKKGISVEVDESIDQYEVQKLFEVESCRIYRFWDSGRSHYFSTCVGEISKWENCGKNCWRDESIKTNVKK